MSLWRRARMAVQMVDLLKWQGLLIEAKELQIEQMEAEITQLNREALLAQRSYLSLAIAFQEAIEVENPDISEKLEWIICDVADFVARMEEHTV